MIVMLLCAGGDESGIGISASDSTAFDCVGDICLSWLVELTDGRGGDLGAAISGELTAALLSG